MPKQEVTAVLQAWRAGTPGAADQLFTLVYDELRRMARGRMRGERQNHTLQPTALVHEAYVRLNEVDLDWKDRAQFFAMAATEMRRVLIDHAKAAAAIKRGGGLIKVQLQNEDVAKSDDVDLVALGEALEELRTLSPRLAKIVDLRYFGGMSFEEMAWTLQISLTTTKADWKKARGWLRTRLEQ
ncbi:MAG: sigma-70 family RNA polymerase sigma factor [Acidobacteria bacterium]|nr:sigma-70 family RNA polymerase sigma factor [Acidobacteriota bacterium]